MRKKIKATVTRKRRSVQAGPRMPSGTSAPFDLGDAFRRLDKLADSMGDQGTRQGGHWDQQQGTGYEGYFFPEKADAKKFAQKAKGIVKGAKIEVKPGHSRDRDINHQLVPGWEVHINVEFERPPSDYY